MELGVVLTAVVADVAQSSAGLQQDLLVCGAEQLDEGRDEAGLHAGAPHELWQRQQPISASGWERTGSTGPAPGTLATNGDSRQRRDLRSCRSREWSHPLHGDQSRNTGSTGEGAVHDDTH